jgi:hypothetical protein
MTRTPLDFLVLVTGARTDTPISHISNAGGGGGLTGRVCTLYIFLTVVD